MDEAGTVAAAVTMVKAVPYSLILNKPEPVVFIADHPFLFALTFNNHPIFMGVFQSKWIDTELKSSVRNLSIKKKISLHKSLRNDDNEKTRE